MPSSYTMHVPRMQPCRWCELALNSSAIPNMTFRTPPTITHTTMLVIVACCYAASTHLRFEPWVLLDEVCPFGVLRDGGEAAGGKRARRQVVVEQSLARCLTDRLRWHIDFCGEELITLKEARANTYTLFFNRQLLLSDKCRMRKKAKQRNLA